MAVERVDLDDVKIPSLDELTNETAKPKSTPRKTTTARTTTRSLQKEIYGAYVALGGAVMLWDSIVGQAIIDKATDCAIALNDLAQKDKKLFAALEKMFTTGVYGQLLMAHLPILAVIAVRHIPAANKYAPILPQMFGVNPFDPEPAVDDSTPVAAPWNL